MAGCAGRALSALPIGDPTSEARSDSPKREGPPPEARPHLHEGPDWTDQLPVVLCGLRRNVNSADTPRMVNRDVIMRGVSKESIAPSTGPEIRSDCGICRIQAALDDRPLWSLGSQHGAQHSPVPSPALSPRQGDHNYGVVVPQA